MFNKHFDLILKININFIKWFGEDNQLLIPAHVIAFVLESLHEIVILPWSHPVSQHYLFVLPHTNPPALVQVWSHALPFQYLPPEIDATTEQTRSLTVSESSHHQ